jgi:hypothetical protein
MNISMLKNPPPHTEARHSVEHRRGGAVTGSDARVKERLWHRMMRECEAMVEHAFATGRVVPIEVMESLDRAILAAAALPDRHEVTVPADAVLHTDSESVSTRLALLAPAHAGLALAIAPATPEAVSLMAEERKRHPMRCEYGPLPLVRQMLGLALLSLVILLGVSISEVVNSGNVNKSLLDLSGYPLLMVELFLISAASLGSCFANLQKINAVISDGTYDPRVQSTYWTRWVMGVISGVVLSQIVYDFFLHSGKNPESTADAIGQPILALVGGYSVDLVHDFLKRVINALRTLLGLGDDRAGDTQPRAVATEASPPSTEPALAVSHEPPARAPAGSLNLQGSKRTPRVSPI